MKKIMTGATVLLSPFSTLSTLLLEPINSTNLFLIHCLVAKPVSYWNQLIQLIYSSFAKPVGYYFMSVHLFESPFFYTIILYSYCVQSRYYLKKTTINFALQELFQVNPPASPFSNWNSVWKSAASRSSIEIRVEIIFGI